MRGVDRWGHVAVKGLHINSLAPLLRSLLSDASIALAVHYSGHWPQSRSCETCTDAFWRSTITSGCSKPT